MKKRPTTTETPEELVTQLRALLHEAEQVAGTPSAAATTPVHRVTETIVQAQERAGELYAAARQKVAAGAKSADAAVRSHPYESVAIALGVGVLVGALLRRSPA